MFGRRAGAATPGGGTDGVEAPRSLRELGVEQRKQQQQGGLTLRITLLICALTLGSAPALFVLGQSTLSLTGIHISGTRLSLLLSADSAADKDAPRIGTEGRNRTEEKGGTDERDGTAATGDSALAWGPRPGKFLLAYCTYGQISNRLLCLRNHVQLAGLLNRTLLVPYGVQEQADHAYDMRLVWNLQHTRSCLGEQAVMTTEEFRAQYAGVAWPWEALRRALRGGRPHSVAIHCWRGPPEICGSEDQYRAGDPFCPLALRPGRNASGTAGQEQLMLDAQSHLHSMLYGKQSTPQGRLRPLLPSRKGSPVVMRALCLGGNETTSNLIQALYSRPENILVVGDLVDKSLLHGLAEQGHEHPFRMRAPQGGACRWSLLRPPASVMRLGTRILRGMMGGGQAGVEQPRFLSVHWRRGDFIGYCHVVRQSDSCTYGPEQAARCMLQKAAEHNLSRIFLATNADDSEVANLSETIKASSQGQVQVHRLTPDHLATPSAAQWSQQVPGVDIEQQKKLLLLTLEKLIAARALVFLGSVWSTFTKDIQSMRSGLQLQRPADAFLCNGEVERSDDGLPEWMVQERRFRRWRRAFLGSPALNPQDQVDKKHVVEVFSWLHHRSWKGLRGLPTWYMRDRAWQQWLSKYPLEKGISEQERSERQWLVQTVRDMEAGVSGADASV